MVHVGRHVVSHDILHLLVWKSFTKIACCNLSFFVYSNDFANKFSHLFGTIYVSFCLFDSEGSIIPHFSLNIKPYDKSISTKTLGDQIQLKTKDLFEKGSLGNYSLTQHYIEDNTLISLAQGKLSISSSYKEMNTMRTLAGRKLKVSC